MKKKLLIGLILAVLVIFLPVLPALLNQNNTDDENQLTQEGMVQVRVCGMEGVVFDEITDSTGCANAKELLEKAVGKEKITYDNRFITSVMGVDGVVYYTVKDGVYEAPAISVAEYSVSGLDEIVFYHYNLAPVAVDAVKQGDEIILTVTKAEFDANFAIAGWQPLAGATAQLGGQTVTTNAEGKAVLPITESAEAISIYAKDTAGNYVTVPVNLALTSIE